METLSDFVNVTKDSFELAILMLALATGWPYHSCLAGLSLWAKQQREAQVRVLKAKQDKGRSLPIAPQRATKCACKKRKIRSQWTFFSWNIKRCSRTSLHTVSVSVSNLARLYWLKRNSSPKKGIRQQMKVTCKQWWSFQYASVTSSQITHACLRRQLCPDLCILRSNWPLKSASQEYGLILLLFDSMHLITCG